MVYVGRNPLDLSPRDENQEAKTKQKNKEAAENVAKRFFQEHLGIPEILAQESKSNGIFDPNTIQIFFCRGVFTLKHRGYEIAISTGNPGQIEASLRAWCKDGTNKMTHVRIRNPG